MIKNISDILVVSDVDGTLLPPYVGVPQKNIEAIRLFKSLGGQFTFSTGRSIQSARKLVELLKINIPVILYNGSVIYDYLTETPLCFCNINMEQAKLAIKDILADFPTIGIEIMTATAKTCTINANDITHQRFVQERIPYFITTIDDLNENAYKVLLAVPDNIMYKVNSFLKNKNYKDIYFVQTSDNYLEMLPLGINKAKGLQKLCEILHHDINDTYAIGDYYNDIDMLQVSGRGVAVDNALPQVKEKAKIHVASCFDAGVAELLQSLIHKYF